RAGVRMPVPLEGPMGEGGWPGAGWGREKSTGQLAGPRRRGVHSTHEPGGLVKFHAPEIVFGPGALAEPGHCAARLGARRHPVALPAEVEQSVLRWTGEALFNAAAHGKATRVLVRLRYLAGAVLSGRHRGLANMLAMAEELGGTLSIRRSRPGGVFLRLDIPLPLPGRGGADGRPPAQGCGGDG
ncbi:MAG TPA: hypothetical protein VMU66_04155, partial [Gaiellales bacterium]|nr:hypothetical protein [Gaiellales bacterium]